MRLLPYILLMSTLLFSCRTPYNMQKNIDCSVPVPECTQSQWQGTPLDTSYYNSNKNYFYVIKQVDGLNTIKQEYSILLDENVSSISDNKFVGYATISNYEGQNIYSIVKTNKTSAPFTTNDSFTPKDEYIPSENGSSGFPTYLSEDNLLVANTQKSYYPSSEQVQLAPVSATIGQSRLYETTSGNLAEIGTSLTQEKQYLVWESHPSYDRKYNLLFFASDRKGGLGGVDIWYMSRKGDSWSEPVNCGAGVNSPCDDITPFVSPTSQELYFSTQARNNVGGYDIFKVRFELKNGKPLFMGRATNLGKPLNTEFDEMAPSFPDYPENFFYYSSNQDGDFDIYVMEKVFKQGSDSLRYKESQREEDSLDFTFKDEQKIDSIKIDPTFTLEGVVKDNRTDKPIENIDVTVKKDNEDKVHKTTKTNEDGKYKFMLSKGHWYKVEIKNDTLFDDSYKVFVDKNDTTSTVSKDLAFDIKKTVRINFKYDESDEPYEYILDSLGNQINTTWQEAIKSLANDIIASSKLLDKVIITGHTDPVGSRSYNYNLGQRRAEFVLSKLVESGVPIYLLKAESKGETKKLVKLDNESDEQYHKRLRRVTLEKIFTK